MNTKYYKVIVISVGVFKSHVVDEVNFALDSRAEMEQYIKEVSKLPDMTAVVYEMNLLL